MLAVRAPSDAALRPAGPPLRLGPDGACLVAFSVAGPLLAVAGGGRLGLPCTLDTGTMLATLACVGAGSSVMTLSPRDRTVLALCALTWLAPDGRVIAVGLTAASVMAAFRASRIPASLWTLWLAIAVHILWAPLLFRLIGRWMIAIEMSVIGAVARGLMPDIQVVGARIQSAGGWYVYVLEGCSAFAGLSASALVWFATLRLLGEVPSRRAVLGLAAGLCGVVAVNVARILLMLPSEAAYRYWHLGAGSTVPVAAGVALGAGPALLTSSRR